MQNYMLLVKNLYQTSTQIINSYTDSSKTKAAIVKIDKSATIYDARSFNNTQLDINKCIKTLTHLIYLFNQGETFTNDETNQLFFSMTKLLQTQDAALRRILYVIVKEMRNQPSIFLVTSSLLKDIHHKNFNFRRNSLRTIPMVIDASNLAQIERYIKGLIADPDIGVSSGALLSGLQIFQTNEELVKKWSNEITQKLNSKDPFIQYHVLMLLGDIKKKDVNSFIKILFSLMKRKLTGIAAVQHLRMLREIAQQIQYDSPEAKQFVNFLNSEVRNKDDIVQIQACKLACESPFMSNKDLLEVIKILEPFLVSQSTVKKYSVLKIFNSLLKNPSRKSLIVNAKQIQKVLNDSNTSLSSIAASILLRICSEGYLETLFTRIQKTMSEMSIEYKKDVVKSLGNVLKTYPKKYDLINRFLLSLMKRQESIEIKSQAIEVMNFEITEIGGQAKSQCIKQLVKFLSSTNYHRIHFQILGIISREASKADINGQIFKNIISQIYLQQGAVRACGLSTLIKLSQFEQNQKAALEVTISKFKNDNDQQVRERLLFRQKQKSLTNYELDLIQNYLNFNCKQIQSSTDSNLLHIDTIKKWGADVGPSLLKIKTSSKQIEAQKSEINEQQKYKQIFENHPTFKDYGELRKINKPQSISDSQGQLNVYVRIFFFDEAIIAEFKIENRIHNSVLQNLKIQLKHSGQAYEVVHIIPAKSIGFSHTGECYVGLKKIEDCEDKIVQQKFTCIAKYTVKQIAGENIKATYQDQFSLEDFQIKLSTYMVSWTFEPADFSKIWQSMEGFEENGTFQLKYASTQAAEQELLKHFGLKRLQIAQGSNKPGVIAINLAGKFLGVTNVLIVLIIAFDTKMGCLLKIKVKTEDEQLTSELVESIS